MCNKKWFCCQPGGTEHVTDKNIPHAKDIVVVGDVPPTHRSSFREIQLSSFILVPCPQFAE